MSNIQANIQETVPSFWTRLARAIEESGVSYEERLEKRVSWLEAEVARLSAAQKKPAKN